MSLKRPGGAAGRPGSPSDSGAGGFSRRSFLRGSGAAVAAASLVAPEGSSVADDANRATVVSGPVQATLNINGEDRTVKLEPRTTLLEVLRDQLNLTGCKDLQDVSADGADTVIIDGKAAFAGATLALSVRGKPIRTVESLRQGGAVDPVVAGFVKHDAMQCGFCTPGFVMATRAFLDAHPGATLEQIREGLGGNICRCGTYDGITKCALELARG
jgi:xanthine dehydrogenase YagT iron-sulfur-binding subunit